MLKESNMNVFISQPMKDKTDAQIKTERKKAIDNIKAKYPNENVEILDSFFEGAPHNVKPLWFLGKSFEILSNADLAYFIGDWKNYRGCCMEHKACEEYGIETIDE
jgi:mRNA degradation ribonuclease J1/J2